MRGKKEREGGKGIRGNSKRERETESARATRQDR